MSNKVKKYHWDFGDGETSTEKKPTHQYKMPGTYLVVLTVTDFFNNEITVSKYVYMYQWDYIGNGLNVSTTDQCLRWALPQKKEQGIGWSFYDGVNFPYPEGLVGTCLIMDENEEHIPLVIDSRTFKIHELGKRDNWTDISDEYGGGLEIESEIVFREQRPPVGASAKLKHNQSHLNIKPWLKERRNTGEYNSDGFRAGFNLDLFIRQNAEPTDAAITKEVPQRGQLVYDRHFVSDFLQEGAILRNAPWRLVNAQMFYEQLDIAGGPQKKLMTEMSNALELTEPLLWLARSENLAMDFATAQAVSGTFLGSFIGPDGFSNSARVFAPSDGMVVYDFALPESFTFMAWVKLIDEPIRILRIDNLTVSIAMVDATYVLQWNYNGDIKSIPFSGSLYPWTHVALVKTEDSVLLYEQGQYVNKVESGDVPALEEDLELYHGAIMESDTRILPRAISSNAIEYVYNDMIQNYGNVTCPVF